MPQDHSKPIPDVRIVVFDPLPGTSSHPLFLKRMCTARTEELPSTPGAISLPPSAIVCTRIPPIPDTHNTTECILYARNMPGLFMEPGFSKRPPPPLEHPSLAYQIRDTASKGKGMFATRSLEIGELINVERPLMVLPVGLDLRGVESTPELSTYSEISRQMGVKASPMCVYEPTLEVAFNRMSKENQKFYLELSNSHKNDSTPRLLSIWDTNCFGIRKLATFRSANNDFNEMFKELTKFNTENDDFIAVFKEMSRINHSCRPNCAMSYDPSSFSFQLRATRPIAKGEEIVYCYCLPAAPKKERQKELKSYGFSCTCLSCQPTPSNPSNDAIRTSMPDRPKQLRAAIHKDGVDNPHELYKTSTKLLRDLKQEGMDGTELYYDAMEIHVEICDCLYTRSKDSDLHETEVIKKREDELRSSMYLLADLALAHAGSYSLPDRYRKFTSIAH